MYLGLIGFCVECLGHLPWGYAEPSEDRNEYRDYNGIDQFGQHDEETRVYGVLNHLSNR